MSPRWAGCRTAPPDVCRVSRAHRETRQARRLGGIRIDANETGPNETGLNETRPNETGPNRTRPNAVRSERGAPAARRLSFHYFVPGVERLRRYGISAARADAIAGAVVAVLLVPQAVAYAQLAGLPASSGLYAAMLPLLVYAFAGARATVSIGPVALVSILVAEAVAAVETDLDPTEVASLLTLMVGAILAVAGLLRLGFLVRFVSSPVMKGFTAAAAVLIALSQVGAMTGLELERGGLPATLSSLLAQLDTVHIPTLVVSSVALLAFLLAGRPWQGLVERLLGDGPGALALAKAAPLAVIVAVIGLSAGFGWADGLGIGMVGALDSGPPTLEPPPLETELVVALAPAALAIAAIVFVIASGIASSLGSSPDANGPDDDDSNADGSSDDGSDGNSSRAAGATPESTTPDRESIALGAANLAGALSGGYVVGASFSRSALAASAGARTAFTLGVTAALVALVTLFAGQAFAFLPSGVLGALIVSAVWSLIDVDTMRRVWRFSRTEALTLFLTTIAVLFGGLRFGIAVGALAGLALYLYGTSRPRVAVEGRLRDGWALRDETRDDVVPFDDGRLVVRVDESLYFGNADHVERCIGDALDERPATELLMLDLKAVDQVDFTALQMLERTVGKLRGRGIGVHLVGARPSVRERLERFGIVERCGGAEHLHESEHEAVAALGDSPQAVRPT